MKKWQFWLGVLIGAICIFWAFSQIEDWNAFGQALAHRANYFYLIPITAAYFAIMLIRTLRWRVILNECGHTRLSSVWTSLLVCYMGNNIFPLRAGEFMRVFMVGKLEEEISYSSALATVVVERLFDFLGILAFLALVLVWIEFPADGLIVNVGGEDYNLETLITNMGWGTLAGTGLLLVFLFFLYLKTDFVLSLSAWFMKPLPEKWREKILDTLRTFAAGLAIMGRPRSLALVTFLSLAAWIVNLTPIWLAGLALGYNISLINCMFLMVVGGAAASIPGPPGFIGTFHALNQKAFTFMLGADPGVALLFAIMVHGCYYFPITIAGAIAARRAGYSLTRLREEAEEAEHEVKGEPERGPE